MPIVGYCFGIRSERRLGDEVHLNLAYRWFCRLGLDGDVPDHSTFSKNRHGCFRESDLPRELFETWVATLDRTAEQFDVTPSRLVADGGCGSAEMVGWLMDERGIDPHENLIDKAERTDGTLSRSDFAFDPESNLYVCPGGKGLRKYHRAFSKPRDGLTKDGTTIYFARKHDCEACALSQVLPERSCTNIALDS